MADRFSLSVQPRTITGKKVKQLRRDGMLPANIYGHNVDSVAVSVPTKEFTDTFKKAGETGLIDISIENEKAARPVLVHSLLQDPVTSAVLHVDFYQVNLKEKLVATVPLQFVGESPIVHTKEGILLELLQEVEVESLPTDIPAHIEVDVTSLTEVDQGILVSDLKLPAGVEMKTDAEEMVCKIETAQMAEEEVEELSTPESIAEDEATTEAEAEEASGNE